MPEVERSAPSVEEAIDDALAALGVSEQEVTVEVVQEPAADASGTRQPAIVRVRAPEAAHQPDIDTASDGSDEDGDVAEEVQEDQADVAADFVEDLLERMGIAAEVEITEVDGTTYVDIWGEDDEDAVGALIGRRGATLDGIQELVKSVIQHQMGERCEVLVDVEDYRKRRRSQVLRTARDAAAQVQRSGRELALEPMTAYERKLVHDVVASVGGLQTASQGDEPGRRVVIRPAH